jgi:hypothetical protein
MQRTRVFLPRNSDWWTGGGRGGPGWLATVWS